MVPDPGDPTYLGAAYAGTTDEYRLDVVTDSEPDTPQAVFYFTAADVDAACRQAQRLLAAVDGVLVRTATPGAK